MKMKLGEKLYKIRRAYRRWKWQGEGAPMLEYSGYHCGICGKWIEDRFFVPSYRSDGEWQDTVGLCPKCRLGYPKEAKKSPWQEHVGWD